MPFNIPSSSPCVLCAFTANLFVWLLRNICDFRNFLIGQDLEWAMDGTLRAEQSTLKRRWSNGTSLGRFLTS